MLANERYPYHAFVLETNPSIVEQIQSQAADTSQHIFQLSESHQSDRLSAKENSEDCQDDNEPASPTAFDAQIMTVLNSLQSSIRTPKVAGLRSLADLTPPLILDDASAASSGAATPLTPAETSKTTPVYFRMLKNEEVAQACQGQIFANAKYLVHPTHTDKRLALKVLDWSQ